MMRTGWTALTLACLALGLAGCAQDNSVGRFKVGKPYSIAGKTYYPEENYTSIQTGIASWYGPGFHGKRTANGERFDETADTAAHPTLQMPSLVRVTNLENGKSLVVRVNDRGPFHSNRVMDVSKAAADHLGFRLNGTARVRLQVMGPESQALAQAAKQGIDTRGAETAMNDTGRLDERFAAFYPTMVATPQPNMMVAASGYQPGLPIGAQPDNAMPLAVPQNPADAGQQIILPERDTASVDPVSAEPIQPTPGMLANIEPRETVRAPAKPSEKPQTFQMSPIGEANAAEIIPARAPNRLPENPSFKGVTASKIYVQAGSAMSRASANKLREQLAPMGNATVVPAASNGLPYFKVQIGPLENTEKANALASTLQKQGRQATVVVGRN